MMTIKDIMRITCMTRNGSITFVRRQEIPYRVRDTKGGKRRIYEITEEEIIDLRKREAEKPRGAPGNKFNDAAISELLGKICPSIPAGNPSYQNIKIWN